MKRNNSIECLRCLLMLAIVSHHCFVYGVYSHTHALWTALFTTLICWHVDAFLSITGWFGTKFSWRKVINLYGQILFYSTLSMLYCAFFTEQGLQWGGGITGGWFGDTYLALVLLSPILNAAIERLLQAPRRTALFVWLLFAALITLSWLPTHAFTAVAPMGVDGHSLVLFMFIYFTLRMVRLCEIGPLKKRVLALGAVAFVCMFALFGIVDKFCVWGGVGHLSGIGRVFASYDGPHVWIAAIALFLFFVWHVKLPEVVGKIFGFMGPSMFGVYLLSDTTSFGRLAIEELEKWLVTNVGGHPMFVIVLASVSVFLVCLAVDLMRRGVVKLVMTIWTNRK